MAATLQRSISPSFGQFWRKAVAVLLMPPLMLLPLGVAAQPVGLPSLGDTAATTLSPRVEQRLGDALMAEGRRDPSYIDDPAINQYLSRMAGRLAQHVAGAPPQLSVFSIRDPSINAFAMPGGYIGVHSGLVASTQNESELAGVVAHEIAHVSQRHVARGLAQQGQSSIMLLGLMLGALAAALAGASQLAMGAAAFGQAAVINSQLSFSREAEREADRIGIQMLEGAGYDPAGMASMFGRMLQSSRFNQAPTSYASTHPLTLERMSDMQNRLRGRAGVTSSDTYWFVRARLRALQAGTSRVLDPLAELREEARNSQGVRAAAAWYGAAVRQKELSDLDGAAESLAQAKALGVRHPMLTQLEAELALAQDQPQQALNLSRRGVEQWPDDRALALTHARILQRQQQHAEAARFLEGALKRWPNDEPEFYRMAAYSQAAQGQAVAEARYLAGYYERIGALPSALAQLQRARSLATDFHEQSVLDARVREMRQRIEEDKALLADFRM